MIFYLHPSHAPRCFAGQTFISRTWRQGKIGKKEGSGCLILSSSYIRLIVWPIVSLFLRMNKQGIGDRQLLDNQRCPPSITDSRGLQRREIQTQSKAASALRKKQWEEKKEVAAQIVEILQSNNVNCAVWSVYQHLVTWFDRVQFFRRLGEVTAHLVLAAICSGDGRLPPGLEGGPAVHLGQGRRIVQLRIPYDKK